MATTELAQKVEAGREADALIAERVMGLKARVVGRELWVNHSDAPSLRGSWKCARYSTDISAAWRVVEKIKGEWHFEIRVEHSGCPSELWDCLILSDGIGGITGLVSREAGEEAPLAICRAALKAVEQVQDTRA